MMRILTTVSRLLAGFVFIFSGFVKGVDPLGTAYKMEDYFIAYGIEWLMPASLVLAIILVTAEFLIGITLVFNLKIKWASWGLLLMMSFFTIVTFYDALENPVPDCGCFGDALTLTNWQTFYKNIFLMIPTIIVFIRRNRINQVLSWKAQGYITAGVAVLFVAFSYYNYQHLPMIDFRNWKVGNKMYLENPEPVKYYLTFRNKETGEEKEFLSPNYPYNDSAWMSKWEYVDKRVVDPNEFEGHELQILDSAGNDYTDNYIRNPDYQFILIAKDIEKANREDFEKIKPFAQKAGNDGYEFIALASGGNIYEYKEKIEAGFPFYQADEIVLKTMIRANPGLMLMKDGEVLAKWHNNDFPAYKEVKAEYIKESQNGNG
ncbi:MAG: DoxX family protein [Bacteroidales bacterium]|nr:DoxX family protein [Bacteroidales bacterium]